MNKDQTKKCPTCEIFGEKCGLHQELLTTPAQEKVKEPLEVGFYGRPQKETSKEREGWETRMKNTLKNYMPNEGIRNLVLYEIKELLSQSYSQGYKEGVEEAIEIINKPGILLRDGETFKSYREKLTNRLKELIKEK